MLKKNIRINTLHSSLIRLNKIHKKMAKKEFQKVDLTEGKPRLLDFIISNPGCSQREIASCCKIEPATATSILSSMEKEELIYRERNPKDKRILNVSQTLELFFCFCKIGKEIFDAIRKFIIGDTGVLIITKLLFCSFDLKFVF